jgi:hypothetical protein
MRYTFLLTAMLMLAGCFNLFGPPSREEVAWANSPDGLTHAILLETNGGATTSYGYKVELHPAPHQGEEPVPAGGLYGATRSECAYGVNLRWLSPAELALEFSKADNVDVPAEVNVGGRAIAITTRSGVLDPDAPCGGMAVSRS